MATPAKTSDGAVDKYAAASAIDLGAIDSFEAAIKALASEGIQSVDSSEYGDGFVLLKDKDKLIDQTFVIVGVRSAKSDFGGADDTFVAVSLVTQASISFDGMLHNKFVIVDGSTGIRNDLNRIGANAIGMVVRNGLRKSDFYFNENTGEISSTKGNDDFKPAKTYYINGM